MGDVDLQAESQHDPHMENIKKLAREVALKFGNDEETKSQVVTFIKEKALEFYPDQTEKELNIDWKDIK